VENEITAAKISLSEARIEQFDIEAALSYANQFIRNLDRQWFDLTAKSQTGSKKWSCRRESAMTEKMVLEPPNWGLYLR
jgi:hypothetical protein